MNVSAATNSRSQKAVGATRRPAFARPLCCPTAGGPNTPREPQSTQRHLLKQGRTVARFATTPFRCHSAPEVEPSTAVAPSATAVVFVFLPLPREKDGIHPPCRSGERGAPSGSMRGPASGTRLIQYQRTRHTA